MTIKLFQSNFGWLTFLLLIIDSFLSSSLKASENIPLSTRIFQATKSYKSYSDTIFVDGLGREVYFRGWNISGAVKLKSMGFKPFKTQKDAAWALQDLKRKTGSNIIRYTLSWEGVHPQVDTIDIGYLEEITFHIKEAIKNKIYVLLDYHQDLYSRHLFHKNSKFTGNGAPAWVTPKENYPNGTCFLCVHWGMNKIFNKSVRLAFRNFWDNAPIETQKGVRHVQDEFFWQMKEVIAHLKRNLNEKEQNFIIGINPMNEPIDGGFGKLSSQKWYSQKMRPFNKRVRDLLDEMGWEQSFVFAEPLVFWITNAPTIPANPPFNKQDPPLKGFVFNSHYYDAQRMSFSHKTVKNGSYLANTDHIKSTAAKLKRPPFLSEFGMFIKKGRVQNQVRMIEATYQGMEISKEQSSSFASFYSPVISGTQWHWDIYHNQHRELQNENPNRVITEGDAWNNENFSIVTDGGFKYTTPDQFSVERAWPRRCQGRIMHFYYKGRPDDGRNGRINWIAMKFSPQGPLYLKDHDFFFMVWQGNKALGPTEIYLPPHFRKRSLTVMTEQIIKKGLGRQSKPKQHVFSLPDILPVSPKTGERVFIWNQDKIKGQLHFFLAIKENKEHPLDKKSLKILQQSIKKTIKKHQSPLFFRGKVKIDKVHVGRKSIRFKY